MFHRKTEGPGLKPYEKIWFSELWAPWQTIKLSKPAREGYRGNLEDFRASQGFMESTQASLGTLGRVLGVLLREYKEFLEGANHVR